MRFGTGSIENECHFKRFIDQIFLVYLLSVKSDEELPALCLFMRPLDDEDSASASAWHLIASDRRLEWNEEIDDERAGLHGPPD